MPNEIQSLKMESEDLIAERIEEICRLFPEIAPEGNGHIDFDMLRLILGDNVDDGDERYTFTWPGKTAAIRQSQSVSTGTLRPNEAESVSAKGTLGSWDSTENLYIEGDNLEVLKLLQASYHGTVKFIYIDPPYNTGKDFVYRDSFGDTIQNYREQTGQTDQSNPETAGRYHANWCTMMYPRLRLARELLNDYGVMAVSIDDNELSNLMRLIQEIFGDGNILTVIPRVTKKAGKSSEAIAKNHDYIVLVAKTERVKLYPPVQENTSDYPFTDEYVDERGPYKLNQCLDYDSLQYSASLDYPIEINGEVLYPGGDYDAYLARQAGNHARADWAWRWSREKFEFGLKNGFVVVKQGKDRTRLYTKTYLNAVIDEEPKGSKQYVVSIVPRTISLSTLEYVDNQYSNDNASKGLASLFDVKGIFDYSKPVSLVQSLISLCSAKDDIILDFFSGSGTTAQAVMAQNAKDAGKRRYILVQLPEPLTQGSVAARQGYKNLCELGKERITRAGKSIAGKSSSSSQKSLLEDNASISDIGFRVLKLDDSNFDQPKPGELVLDIVKAGRTDLDIVFECMLRWGLDLALPVEKEEINGYPCYSVAADELICCMETGLTEDCFEAIAARSPKRVLIRDSVLDDTLKLNAVAVFNRGTAEGDEIDLRTV